jgi:hypothetical protein
LDGAMSNATAMQSAIDRIVTSVETTEESLDNMEGPA